MRSEGWAGQEFEAVGEKKSGEEPKFYLEAIKAKSRQNNECNVCGKTLSSASEGSGVLFEWNIKLRLFFTSHDLLDLKVQLGLLN